MFCVISRIHNGRVKFDIEAYRGQRALKRFNVYEDAERHATVLQEVADGQHKSRLDKAAKKIGQWIRG